MSIQDTIESGGTWYCVDRPTQTDFPQGAFIDPEHAIEFAYAYTTSKDPIMCITRMPFDLEHFPKNLGAQSVSVAFWDDEAALERALAQLRAIEP